MSTTKDLLQAVRTVAPDLAWKQAEYLRMGAVAGVDARLADGRWVNVGQHDRAPVFRVDVSCLVRELPSEEGEPTSFGDVSRFYAGRTWSGEDLAAPLAAALADDLAPREVLGLQLYPHRPAFGGQGWQDEAGRYEFRPDPKGGWEWKLVGRVPDLLRAQFRLGGEIGGCEATLAEAVAAARSAPLRIGALLTALAEEYGRPPSPPSWTYAAQVVAKDGERVVVGPMGDLLALKTALRGAEKPFYGRMNTDDSFIAAVQGEAGPGAEDVLAHPEARRLKR